VKDTEKGLKSNENGLKSGSNGTKVREEGLIKDEFRTGKLVPLADFNPTQPKQTV
jgi:hypothetical protein